MLQSIGARLATVVALGALAAALVVGGSAAKNAPNKLDKINHIVVVYEENHSFDNLYGGWEGVNGRTNADAAHTTQVDQNGVPFGCLQQLDVNLTSPPLAATCSDTTHGITSAFPNTWFTIDDFIKPTDTTCPQPHHEFDKSNGWAKGTGTPGGCTRDLVHEFYQEQYQLNGGQQNRYMSGSDSVGTTMGVYDTTQLPIYRYLHAANHPHYAIADDFFQSAFGGSFLNHQWLIAAQTPVYPGAPATLHSIIDSNGMPVAYPQYHPTSTVRRGPITVVCPSPVPNRACGDYAVNTMQPPYQPSGTFGAKLIPQTNTTIGDELSAAGISWAWYAGGWSNADGDVGAPGWTNGTGPTCADPRAAPNPAFPYCPDSSFQFHHQPFNYYASFAPGTAGRAHLRDEAEFISLAQGSTSTCSLPSVSFVKPLGVENEHPGYASEPNGSDHLVSLLQDIESSACAKDTMVIVTYDEFGGQWDHVSPPSATNPIGPHDLFGPGTRIPALILAPGLPGNYVVDSTEHDTTSILTTIEHRFGLGSLSSRDRDGNDLSSVYDAKQVSQQ
ncbi:MAG TPA: alkaline phosphatase family protein [Gaiellaceae bacterium]